MSGLQHKGFAKIMLAAFIPCRHPFRTQTRPMGLNYRHKYGLRRENLTWQNTRSCCIAPVPSAWALYPWGPCTAYHIGGIACCLTRSVHQDARLAVGPREDPVWRVCRLRQTHCKSRTLQLKLQELFRTQKPDTPLGVKRGPWGRTAIKELV